MAFEPKTWVTGEVITADDLNQITPLVEPITDVNNAYTTSSNAGVIIDAMNSGRVVYLRIADGDYSVTYYPVLSYSYDDRSNKYHLSAMTSTEVIQFAANDVDSPFVESNV